MKKNKKLTIVDPYAEREAQKYDNPIPSREAILEVLQSSAGPLSHRSLSKQLQLHNDPDQAEALRRRLIAMERDGQLVSNRKGAFGVVDKMHLVRGRVQGHRDGYGFVIPADGSTDLYLTHRQMKKVFSGDEVLVRPGAEDFRGKREGTIVEVIAHNTQQVVGKLILERGMHFVQPDNTSISQDILIPADQVGDAKPGQIVVVEIIQQPNRKQRAAGRVADILGDHLAPGMEIDVAIRSHNIPHEWPEGVLQQSDGFGAEVSEHDKQNRFDLRKLPFVTIDGEDARDFDDAVYCETKRSGGWRLFVAIADVSHYVSVGSALDQEAIMRGNSVYFPDFVVPMLPEILSNGLCSLNPRVDRLCMVCEMTISQSGKISGYKFYEAVMHSHQRFTYTQVGQILSERDKKRSGIRKQFAQLVKPLDVLHDLYMCLRGARDLRGAIDFESNETKIQFDEQRKIERIVPVERNDAHKLIEECMLAANVCAAKFLDKHALPGLFRVHQRPKPEKMEMLVEFLAELGLQMRGDPENITTADYQEIMQQIKGRPDAAMIQTVMLRSMNQAVYQPENLGHFGLAYSAYAHFTSPIRRYPDLLVHRAIRGVIRSNLPSRLVKRHESAPLLQAEEIYPYTAADMVSLGDQCSSTERRADEATRDVLSWLKCEFLQDKVGETFDGVVSGVTGFGLFVELKDMYVEGLIHITALPQDYYRFEPAQHRLVGERTRQVFKLGDELSVQVARVDLDERKVDFEFSKLHKRKRKKVKVSDTAKSLAEGYQDEQLRKSGGRKPRKRVLQEADSVAAKTGASEKAAHKAKVKPAEKAKVKAKKAKKKVAAKKSQTAASKKSKIKNSKKGSTKKSR